MPDEEFDLLAALGGGIEVETEERAGDGETPEFVVTKIYVEKKEIGLTIVADEIAEFTPELMDKLSKRVKDKKKECLRKISNILAEYGGLESNIPITHQYWQLVGQYRTM